MNRDRGVVLFDSVSHALCAEKAAVSEGFRVKLVPVPRHLSSDCGICICFEKSDMDGIRDLMLRTGINYQRIYAM
jgi:hypothetical protein